MKKIFLVPIISVWLLFSLIIRVYGLNASPNTIGFDEASLGYNAYSLMLTGKDEFGTFLPFNLRSFDDYKPAMYSYLTVPFYHVFGVSQTTTRLPSAVLGTISLLFFLLIFKKITKVSWVEALIVAFVISLLPWRIHFSRVALETNISMAFFTIACWFLLHLDNGRKYVIGAVIFSIFSIYSYHSARLALPILWFLTITDPIRIILHRKEKWNINYKLLIPLLIVILSYLPIFLRDSSSSVVRRLSQTNIFNHFYPFAPSELFLTKVPFLSVLGQPLYYLGGIIFGHLFAYFSPRNLAFSIYPGVIKSAQAISGASVFGWMGELAFLLGFPIWAKKFIETSEYRFVVYWILAAVSPALVTWEWFYPLRALNIFPALEIILGLGIILVYQWIKNIKLNFLKLGIGTIFFSLIIVTSVYNVANEYKYSVWDTNGEFQPGGFKEGGPLLDSLRTKYKTVYLDSNQAQSFEMLLFYMHYPPTEIQKYAANRPLLDNDIKNFNFDNFVYKRYNWVEDRDKHSFVYWTSAEVKEEEINATPGAKLYKIKSVLGYWTASIITKE